MHSSRVTNRPIMIRNRAEARDGKRSPQRGMKRGPNLTTEERARVAQRCSLRARPHDLCGIGPGGIDLAFDAWTAAGWGPPRPACLGPGAMRGHERPTTPPTGPDEARCLVP